MPRCAGFKPDNSQCERIVDERSTYCYSHDPTRKEQRQRAASKAGKAKGPGGELVMYKGNIKTILDDLLKGSVDKGVASVAFQGFGLLIRSVEVERKIRETEELEVRLAELEEALERQKSDERSYGYAR